MSDKETLTPDQIEVKIKNISALEKVINQGDELVKRGKAEIERLNSTNNMIEAIQKMNRQMLEELKAELNA